MDLGYKPATQPEFSPIRNIPLYRLDGKFYYRPHHYLVLASVAGLQLQVEANKGWINRGRDGRVIQAGPIQPGLIRLLDFITGAPPSWWTGLNPWRAHIHLLSMESSREKNLLREWLMVHIGIPCDDTKK